MEPALIALLGTLIGGFLMKFLEFKLSKNSVEQSFAKQMLEIANPNKTEFDCRVYSDRLFEKKLVEAEVLKIEDMSVCEDEHCPNCKPAKPKSFPKPPAGPGGGSSKPKIDYVPYNWTASSVTGLTQAVSEIKKKYQPYQPDTVSRIVDFKGTKLFRPYAVPYEAKPVAAIYDGRGSYEIMWESEHQEGKRVFKDVVSDQMVQHWQT
jgi:hypothetical protein